MRNRPVKLPRAPESTRAEKLRQQAENLLAHAGTLAERDAKRFAHQIARSKQRADHLKDRAAELEAAEAPAPKTKKPRKAVEPKTKGK